MEKLNKIGYGQVEPNRLQAQFTKGIFGQLPNAKDLLVIENGMGLVYDEVKGEVRKPEKKGEVVQLHMSEINLADPRQQEDKDFVVLAQPETRMQVAMPAHPRLFALTVGDTFTTNTVQVESQDAKLVAGTKFTSDVSGYWVPADGTEDIVLAVIKDYTMPDGQRGIKFQVQKVGGIA